MRRIKSVAKYQNTKRVRKCKALPYLQVFTHVAKKARWWSEPASFTFDPPVMDFTQLSGAFVGPGAIG